MRERFVSAYDSNSGAIRQMLPRDRAQQDRNKGEIGARIEGFLPLGLCAIMDFAMKPEINPSS